MGSIESLAALDFPDPTKDPEVTAAASHMRFGWGEPLSVAYQDYLSLMEKKGFSNEEALAALKEINSLGPTDFYRDSNETG